MKDIQSQRDPREIPINKVGVKGVKYPINLLDRSNKVQQTIGEIDLFVNLPHNFRGTHMSRFMEIIQKYCKSSIHIDSIPAILGDVRNYLEADSAHIKMTFPYFILKHAPVSKIPSMMPYSVTFEGVGTEKSTDIVMSVAVPVTTLCPCSKEISDYGAHNQRSFLTLSVRSNSFIWIEELVELGEACASAPIYPLLKREDEKYVTEKAYDNPVFAEDIVREAVMRLKNDKRITWFKVEATNLESIHTHNAYACVEMENHER